MSWKTSLINRYINDEFDSNKENEKLGASFSVKEIKNQHLLDINPLKERSLNFISSKTPSLKDLDPLQEEINAMLEKKKYCVLFFSN